MLSGFSSKEQSVSVQGRDIVRKKRLLEKKSRDILNNLVVAVADAISKNLRLIFLNQELATFFVVASKK